MRSIKPRCGAGDMNPKNADPMRTFHAYFAKPTAYTSNDSTSPGSVGDTGNDRKSPINISESAASTGGSTVRKALRMQSCGSMKDRLEHSGPHRESQTREAVAHV